MSRSAALLLCLLGCHVWKAVTKTLREPGAGAQGRWAAAAAGPGAAFVSRPGLARQRWRLDPGRIVAEAQQLDLHRGPAAPTSRYPGGGAAPGTRWARGADAPWGSGWHQLLWLPPRWQPLVTLLLTSEALSFMHDSDTRLHSPCRGKGRRGAHCPLCFPVRGPRAPVLESQHEGCACPFCCSREGGDRRPGVPPVPWGP